ncbi:hypothetical protein PtrV1_10542 [Pyrenophora tritici-repentis]|uniref:Uncharacterized protein n=1 Tax=Pyrenophora tritici-repentis TaxID=45151 RepID=A0A316ZMZ8_9PLEO|nr:hypothetical protein PtrV1_10542 [Pyrenophora tritici-repentis]KAF7567759.1 hypothetical protein PtrM4_143500 [Pyrenophora tritici-repentis]KAI1507207.1 hypothetical protein Ptr86124_013855 [Pyrenophora tritici-repentis]KAI1507741.1 hypothetical protein Ptr86124_013274 [Pyrenophora tritici-repentis]KAI1511030.1 hypothetical protein Ptr86124_010151 [Pyrenophora tritici-repentis]
MANPANTQNTQGTSATGATFGQASQDPTQSQMGPPLVPVRACLSNRRESMLLAAHPSSQPSVSASGDLEPMTATREIVGIEINDVLLEYLKDSNYVYLRYTVDTEWFELQEDPEPDEHSNAFYSLSTGRIRTDGNITHNINDFTVTNSSNLQKNVKDRPDFWWRFIVSTLVSLRNCTDAINRHLQTVDRNEGETQALRDRLANVEAALDETSNSKQLQVGMVSSNLYKEKLTEIRRLTSDIGKLKAASEQLPNVRDDPAFKALAAERDLAATERNELKQKVEDLSRRADEPESGPNYAELAQKLKEESDSADWWADQAKANAELCDKFKGQADRYSIELNQYDVKYSNMEANKNEALALKDKAYDELNLQLTEARRETKTVTDRLLQHEPNYQPYTLWRRERSYDPVRPVQSSVLLQRPVDGTADQLSQDPRRAGYTPWDNRTPVRDASLPPPSSNPYAPAPTVPRPPPVAPSTAGGGFSYKLPELETFKGKVDDDYERWREMAVAKCRTYPEDWQAVDYLKFRIQGEAYEHIRDVKARHFLDFLETLDSQYLTYDREADAETLIADGSLHYKSGQKFMEWKSKFTSCMRILKHKNATQIRYAREFMRPGLAIATTAGSHKDETIQSFLLRAQHIDQGHQQIDAGRKLTPVTKTAGASRTQKLVTFRTPDTPGHNNAASTHTYKKMAFERSEKDKKRLADLKLCFKCGKDDHQMRHETAPCRGKPFTPSHQIPALASLYINALDASNEEERDEDTEEPLDDNDLVDDDGFYVNDEELLEHLN